MRAFLFWILVPPALALGACAKNAIQRSLGVVGDAPDASAVTLREPLELPRHWDTPLPRPLHSEDGASGEGWDEGRRTGEIGAGAVGVVESAELPPPGDGDDKQ